MDLWRTNPFAGLTLVRGQGSTVWDAEGRPYLDLLAGNWAGVLGHAHPGLARAVAAQLETLVHVGPPFVTPPLAEAMARLQALLPPALDRVVFLSSGSEAVDLALKLARAATGGETVAVVEGAYYGASAQPLALSEAGRAAPYLPPPGPVLRLPLPRCSRCPLRRAGCLESFPCLAPLAGAAGRGPRVAAVLYEPVISGAGVVVPPSGWARRLRELARAAGALLVAEEVTTGVGRTGSWWGFQHDDAEPDVLVLGKALGAGLPVAAVIATAEVERACGGRVLHVQSHQNDPLSGRVVAAVLDLLREERLVEAAAARGEELLAGLREVQRRTGAFGEVRGRGLLAGAELAPALAERGPALVERLRARGFLVQVQPSTRALRLFPPYVITPAEVARFLEALEETVREMA